MPLPMFEEKKRKAPKILVGVAAGKGGVGKSTITVFLAESLARRGLKIGVMDCDLYGPSIRRMLPEVYPPAQMNNCIIPAESRMGIKVITMAYFNTEKQASAVRAPVANGIINQFLNQVDWDGVDILLLDFPPGTGDIPLTLAQKAKINSIILVTTPQEIALLDVRKAKNMCDQVGIPILGIVENMSFLLNGSTRSHPFGQGGGKKLADEYGIPLFAEVPLDENICQRCDRGETLFSEDTPSARVFESMAEALLKQLNAAPSSQINLSHVALQDLSTLVLTWSDGRTTHHRLSDLQRQCPCAGCCDEFTGKQLVNPASIPENVEAETIDSVGRYALKIKFTSGCSHGIYTYDFLRSLPVF